MHYLTSIPLHEPHGGDILSLDARHVLAELIGAADAQPHVTVHRHSAAQLHLLCEDPQEGRVRLQTALRRHLQTLLDAERQILKRFETNISFIPHLRPPDAHWHWPAYRPHVCLRVLGEDAEQSTMLSVEPYGICPNVGPGHILIHPQHHQRLSVLPAIFSGMRQISYSGGGFALSSFGPTPEQAWDKIAAHLERDLAHERTRRVTRIHKIEQLLERTDT